MVQSIRWLAAFAAGCLFLAPTAMAQPADDIRLVTLSPPDGSGPWQVPLRSTEVLSIDGGGCAYVTPTKLNLAHLTWRGECRFGLVHGRGVQVFGETEVANEFHYGRTPTATKVLDAWTYLVLGDDGLPEVGYTFSFEGSMVAAPPLVQNSVAMISTYDEAGNLQSTWSVQALTLYCGRSARTEEFRLAVGSDRELAREVREYCRRHEIFFAVRSQTFEVATREATGITYRACTRPGDWASCQGAWAAALAPRLEQINDGIATAVRQNQARMQYLDALYAPLEQRRMESLAARERQRAEQQEAERLAAAAARADFQRLLDRGNAGELFAGADERRARGDHDGAREMLRALVRRFPNSPLAANAANLLGGGAPAPTGGAGRGATAGATPPPRPATPVQAAVPQRSCTGWLDETINVMNDGSAAISYAQQLELAVYSRRVWVDMAERIPVCRADVAAMRQRLAEAQQECRRHGGTACDTGSDRRAASYSQAVMPLVNRIIAQAQGTGPAPAAPASGSCARTPDQELAAFDSEIQALKRDCPQQSHFGMRANLQWAYYLSTEGLNRLEPRRACLGPHYEANRRALVDARDAAKSGCDAHSSGPLCTATCPR